MVHLCSIRRLKAAIIETYTDHLEAVIYESLEDIPRILTVTRKRDMLDLWDGASHNKNYFDNKRSWWSNVISR